jgi:polysaccharide pyruvyl transferase WcaK-like protein
VDTIAKLFAAAGEKSDGGASYESPEDVARAVGRCRVVVTGSYHAGVFALSQGVPVLALSKSAYYDNKFNGLADMFGTGCTVLRTDAPDFNKHLKQAILEAYDRAPGELEPLLAAARDQISASRAAYERMAALVMQGEAAA